MATACTNGLDTGFVDLGATKVAVLGAIEGVTETLAVSATAHTRLVPALIGWADPGGPFVAALQIAVVIAIVVHFRRDVWRVTGGALGALQRDDYAAFEFRLAVGMLVASLPLAFALLVGRRALAACESALNTLWVVGGATLAVAVALAIAELVRRHERSFDEIRLRDVAAVGLAQALAVVPGVSWLGATLAAALLVGLRRADAIRLAAVVALPMLVFGGLRGLMVLRRAGLDAAGWKTLGLGLAVATVAAVVGLALLRALTARFGTWPLVAYRALLGAFLLLVAGLGVLE